MKQPSRWRIAQNCLHLLEEVYLLDRFLPQTTRNELATSSLSTVSARRSGLRLVGGASADPQV